MIGILILSLSILLAGALPWWPYSAAGRLRHHRPWDWLMDSRHVTDEKGPMPEVATIRLRPASGSFRATRQTVAAEAGRDLLVA
jgi:hypothetical protein